MNEPLILLVREKTDGVPLASFLIVAESFRRVAREVNDVVNLQHEEKGQADLVIVAAHTGSVVLDLRMQETTAAPFDVAREVVGAMFNGLDQLEREAVRPPYFTDLALREAERLVRPLADGVQEIRISRPDRELVLTRRLGEHVRTILNPKGTQVTSVEGRLFRIHMGRNQVGIYDARTKHAITCVYPPALFETVRDLLGTAVRVFGKARTDPMGRVERIEVRQIRPAPPAEGRKPLSELFGIDPDFTGDVDSVQFVRAHRGEQTTDH